MRLNIYYASLKLLLTCSSLLMLSACLDNKDVIPQPTYTPPVQEEPPPSDPTKIIVDCSKGDTIANGLKLAKPGYQLLINGTCTESVWITKDILNVTLDGQSETILIGPDARKNPTSPFDFAIFVEGKGITIKNMEIQGGVHGIHLSGPASAVITGNTIRETAGAIHLDKGSIGQIHANILEDNFGPVINIQEYSYARIGFQIPTQEALAPNIIRNNDGYGIWVQRWSSAWIAGNEIVDNNNHAIVINRNSQADVIGNTLESNKGDGVYVSHNSGVNLSSNDSPRPEVGNLTSSAKPNSGYGILCHLDGYVRGPMGSLTGTAANLNFTGDCVNDVTGIP